MIRHATEEAVEDAFVAYLASLLPGDVKVFAAMTRDEVVYPSVIVTVLSTDNVNESAGWNDHRVYEMEVKLGVEAADVQQNGTVLQTLRERNRELREAVLDALSALDLLAKLNATKHANLSLVVFGAIRRQTDGRIMETVIPLGVTA